MLVCGLVIVVEAQSRIGCRMIKLEFSGIDEDAIIKEFDTINEAIDFAKPWFRDGYDNDTIDDITRKRAEEYLAILVDDLREGKDFHCSMFHEWIKFI